MTLDELFRQRTSIHQKQLAKYMRYVLNDHFVIALIFLLGASGYTYSEYTRTLEAGAVFPRLVLTGILTIILSFGSVATMLKPADSAFILPKENMFFSVIQRLTIRSFFVLSIPIGLVSAAAMPLLVGTGMMIFEEWPLFFLTLLGWKWCELISRVYTFQNADDTKQNGILYGTRSLIFIGLLISTFSGAIFGLGLSLGAAFYAWRIFKGEKIKKRRWQWEKMIKIEEKRLQTIYQFINLFTDVPFAGSETKRLKFLDPWINWVSDRSKETHFFYLIRVFYRNTAYSGLVIRLTLIGCLLVFFSDIFLLTLALCVLFLYLIGFQLIPLLQHLENSLLFRLYPIPSTGKIDAIKQLIFQVLVMVSILFALFSYSLGFSNVVGVLITNIAFSVGFSYVYLLNRIQKFNIG